MPADFEIQLHPGGRGRMRRWRLNRAELAMVWVLAGLYLLLLGVAAGLAPGVIDAWLGGEEYRALIAERGRQGERLLALVARLEELRRRSGDELMRVRKLSLAYGLPEAAAAPSAARGGPPDAAPAGSIYAGTVRQGDRLQEQVRGQIVATEAVLDEVRAFEHGHPDEVRDTPAVCPLRGDRYVLIEPFGRRRSAFTREVGFHAGIDLAAPRDTPIVAPADGIVQFAGTWPLGRSAVWWRLGNMVVVTHGERFVTIYGHCAELAVRAGQRVRRGEPLATVGSSGWSFSPHLHYEIRQRTGAGEAVPVDPLFYILDRRWPDEERLLAEARHQPPPVGYEPLPPGLDRSVKSR
jgi:murein DD-endopeptidase MepM/ murein hydrolase activator NlpD